MKGVSVIIKLCQTIPLKAEGKNHQSVSSMCAE